MYVKRLIVTALVAALTLLGAAIPAAADHTHVKLLGNGQCVVLAEGSGEAEVQLPGYEEFEENRRHPLHVKVHLGEPGERNGQAVIFVKGSEGDLQNCNGYVND